MVASHTPLPVIGVPVESKSLKGLDSLLSIVQMPGGIPVATVAIGGAKNAGLLAVSILGTGDETIRAKILAYKKKLAGESRERGRKLQLSLKRKLPDFSRIEVAVPLHRRVRQALASGADLDLPVGRKPVNLAR